MAQTWGYVTVCMECCNESTVIFRFVVLRSKYEICACAVKTTKILNERGRAPTCTCTCTVPVHSTQDSWCIKTGTMAQSRSQLTPNVSANQAAYSVSIVGKKVTVNTEGTSVASQPRVTVQRPPIQIGGSRRPVTITPISVNTGTLPCNVSTIPTSPTVIEKVLFQGQERLDSKCLPYAILTVKRSAHVTI